MKNVVLVLIVFGLFSCSKENSDSFFPYPVVVSADTAWAAQPPANSPATALVNSLRKPPVTGSFNAASGAELGFPNNLKVSFAANSLRTASNSSYTGNVQVDVIALRGKGDLVRYLKASPGFGRLLEFGGGFLIKATGNGQSLQLGPQAVVRARYPFASSTPMKLFYGIESPPGNTGQGFTWQPSADSSMVSTFRQQDSSGVTTGYEILSEKLNWIMAGRLLDSTAGSRIDVVLPFQFTNANTVVFAVFDNEHVVVQLMPELISRSFLALNIPPGKQLTIVSLSRVGDVIYLGTQQITSALHLLPVSVQPQVKSLAQLDQYLDSL